MLYNIQSVKNKFILFIHFILCTLKISIEKTNNSGVLNGSNRVELQKKRIYIWKKKRSKLERVSLKFIIYYFFTFLKFNRSFMVNQVKILTNIKIDLKIFKCKQEPQPMMLCLNYTPLTLGLIDCLLKI